MPLKGYKQTEEQVRKRSVALKGRTRPDDVKEKIRKTCRTSEYRKNKSELLFGRKLSDETRAKMSKSRMGRIVSPYTRIKIGNSNRGKISPHLGSGKKIRTLKRYAYERDNFTCQSCGEKDVEVLQIDHFKPQSLYPELFEVLSNLVTLCANCHTRKSKREMRDKVYGRWKENLVSINQLKDDEKDVEGN